MSRLVLLTCLLYASLVVTQTTNSCDQYKTAIPGNTKGWITEYQPDNIPSTLGYGCTSGYCGVKCPADATDCVETAKATASKCSPQWAAYSCSRSSYLSGLTGTTTYLSTAYTTYEVVNVANPTTVPTNQTFTFYPEFKWTSYEVTPVWVLGSVVTAYTTTAVSTVYTQWASRSQYPALYTESTPGCSITAVWTYDCGACWIRATGTANIYYWPDQTPGPDGSFPTVTASPPRSTVIDGNTMVSPSVYISGLTYVAQDGCSRTSANKASDQLIKYNPTDIYSYSAASVRGRKGLIDFATKVLNFGDFTTPINAQAYEGLSKCAWSMGCPTIYQSYNPPVSISHTFTNLPAEWSGCSTIIYASVPINTPVPLAPLTGPEKRSEAVLAPPVPTGFVTLTKSPASPCSTPTSPVPIQTGLPSDLRN